MMIPTCPYCGKPAERATGADIYPTRPELAGLVFWRCLPCLAHVGCHRPGTHRYENGKRIRNVGDEPLGRLADQELRTAKRRAHDAFDPIWKWRGMPRKKAYAWLASRLGLEFDQTHIGEFDVAMCRRVVDVCRDHGIS